jgi:hypothetical protein
MNKMKLMFKALAIMAFIAITASAQNVYVAGYTTNAQQIYVATLWKNGVAQKLSDGKTNAQANSVFVSGEDVYVAGSVGGDAVLWKNGVAQNIAGSVNSIFVFGEDVYVAGYTTNAQRIPVATLWKNGVAQKLSDGKTYAQANSIFVH